MAESNTTASNCASISNQDKLPSKDLELQKITTELRLEYLNILTKLEGRQATFNLYKESTPYSGTFRSSDRDNLHFAVSDFETPTGMLKSAMIRTTDIDGMTVLLEQEKPSDSSETHEENTCKASDLKC